jgi:hypothetical protein
MEWLLDNDPSSKYRKWANTPDAHQSPSPMLSTIEGISAEEVIELRREARLNDEHEERPLVDESGEPTQPHLVNVDRAIRQLPQRNLPHARVVYRAFAESETPDDRQQAASFMFRMVPYDRELGFGLWHQLTRDENRRVRLQAIDPLQTFLGQALSYEEAEEGLVKLGISWRDAYTLMESYSYTERGIDLVASGAIGSSALHSLIEPGEREPGDTAL